MFHWKITTGGRCTTVPVMLTVGGRRGGELKLVDDKSDGATDERAVEDLVKQGADLILGHFRVIAGGEKGARSPRSCTVPYVAATGASNGAIYQRGSSICSGSSRRSSSRERADALGGRGTAERQAALARARRHHLGEDLARQRVYVRPIKDFTGGLRGAAPRGRWA